MYEKTFLKWIGEKTHMVGNIIENIPKEIENYHEVFLGGGSILLSILSLEKEGVIKIKGKIYAYDSNKRLINLYRHIQTDKDLLFSYLTYYLNEYNGIQRLYVREKKDTKLLNKQTALTSKESYYYWMRYLFNGGRFQRHNNDTFEEIKINSIESSALFILLNQTCLRGMYKENSKGFITPFGNYKKQPKVITKSQLDRISKLIEKVDFRYCDFNQALNNIKVNDFLYLNPPDISNYNVRLQLDRYRELFDNLVDLCVYIKFILTINKIEWVNDYFIDFPSKQIYNKKTHKHDLIICNYHP